MRMPFDDGIGFCEESGLGSPEVIFVIVSLLPQQQLMTTFYGITTCHFVFSKQDHHHEDLKSNHLSFCIRLK